MVLRDVKGLVSRTIISRRGEGVNTPKLKVQVFASLHQTLALCYTLLHFLKNICKL